MLHFEDGSAMVLNKTNARIVTDEAGIDSLEDAVTLTIVVQRQLVNYRGNLVPGIRVINVS